MASSGGRRAARALAIALVLASAAGPARAAVTVHDPRDVASRWIVAATDGAVLDVADRRWELVTDPSDPAISTLGDGAFHPMSVPEVRRALQDLERITERLDGRLLVLPYPRREVLKSSCEGDAIFLSPGIREVGAAHVHSTVAHEVGHLFQHQRVPEGSAAWTEYLILRGLAGGRFTETALHRDRPREIFAEDFRRLLGGALAGGPHENADLPAPEDVPGLRDWFERIVALAPPRDDAAATATFPNPFSAASAGELEIRFGSPGGPGPATADVYDLAGRRVRVLSAEGETGQGARIFRWDGRDAGGARVGSGFYFVRWRENPAAGTARVQILR